MGTWEEIDHTADLALRVRGANLEDLFTAAAQGMFALSAASAPGGSLHRETFTLSAPDVETLLVDWLNELLYLSERHDVAFTAFAFDDLTSERLAATVSGRPIATRRAGIKAATFHNLEVTRTSDGYATEITFDV